MASALGDFLRGRREAVSPHDVGLVAGSGRRVAGLRREEVAGLAGLSVDYYIRLEQGRERRPSAQAVAALVDALRLDDDARLHLFRLADLAPGLRSGSSVERVDPSLRQLLDSWTEQPALVLGRHYDVLARNRVGRALYAPLTDDNLLLAAFLDPAARSFYAHWHRVAVNTTAGFRLVTSAVPGHPRTAELVDRLHRESPDFPAIWRRNDAWGKSAEVKTFVHPEVGELTLRMETFDVRAAPGQQLVVYHAEPGSPSANAVSLLGTLAATADAEASP